MSGNGIIPDWIAVDWGTSNLRAWAMDADGAVLAEATSDKGMGGLARDGFEPALIELVNGWLPDSATTPVIACGMVGSRQGWVEAPYRAVPCSAAAGTLVPAPSTDPRIAVWLVPGVCQASPPDVMRGEETQIAGFIAYNPGFDGVLCLPGTHSKWVQISAAEIVSFRTLMTGELFALLSRNSVLRHSIGPEGWNDDAFAEALSDTLSRPENLAARLFGLRAGGLLNGDDPASARARLSGVLIGAELAATRPYWLGQPVVLIGDNALSRVYATALQLQGSAPTIAEAASLTRAGLAAARRNQRTNAI